jgi:preprotein translocase subunit YajC
MIGSPLGVAVAAQQASAQGPDFGVFLMFGALFAIFYFLVLRPQQKQRKDLEEAVKTASKGDLAITAGGLHGKIVATDEDMFTLEIASLKGQPVRVQVSRAKVESVTSSRAAQKSAEDAASSAKDKDKDKEKDKDKDKKAQGGGS